MRHTESISQVSVIGREVSSDPSPEPLPSGSAHIARSSNPRINNYRFTTDELAAELGMSAQSIRKRYSQTGSYFGVRPVKLPNRRLLWPADAVDQLTNC